MNGEAFFKGKGVKDAEITMGTINVEKQFDYQYENGNSRRTFLGYKVTQTVTLKSSKVDEVEALSKESMSLVEDGLEFNSQTPAFYYTRLAN